MEFDQRSGNARTSDTAAAGTALAPGKLTLTDQLPGQRVEATSGSTSEAALSGASAPGGGPRPTLQMLFGVQRAATTAPVEDPARPHTAAGPSTATMAGARNANGGTNPAEQAIGAAAGSTGSALPVDLRSRFESSLGADLSNVRVHTGGTSEASAAALGARAYTMGQDIHFGAGHYDPSSTSGKELLAHEVVHTVQQKGHGTGVAQTRRDISEPGDAAEVEADRAAASMMRGAPVVVSETVSSIARSPRPGGTESLHEELIEEYRKAHGLPPHGIDPQSGQQVGPTDSEIRFGGLLDEWLASRSSSASSGQPATPSTGSQSTGAQSTGAQATGSSVRSVAAPAQPPTVVSAGTTSVVAGCQGAPDNGACRQHQTYLQNILPQAISNIRSVPSPYSTAIADMYTAVLPAARAAPAPTPNGRSVDASAGPITVTFGATTHTFTRFTVSLQQWANGANGQALSVGGPIAFILLNEASNDALLRNLTGIEETMIHETVHVFMGIVEARNTARAAGTAPVDPNLDRASYAPIQASLETALRPLITQIRALPSITGQQSRIALQDDVHATSQSFLSEALARTEAGIFTKQRAGQAFTAADLRTLPPFIRTPDYWSPKPAVVNELITFLQTNQTQLDTTIQPLVLQIGERYLNLRP
jgi:hypothetical protein